MEEKNYINDILADGAKLLSSPGLRFPKELSLDDRIYLLQRMIKYFEVNEEYMKCAELEKTLFKLIIKQKQDSNGKRKTVRVKNSISGSQTT
jgi:hypothetical protein